MTASSDRPGGNGRQGRESAKNLADRREAARQRAARRSNGSWDGSSTGSAPGDPVQGPPPSGGPDAAGARATSTHRAASGRAAAKPPPKKRRFRWLKWVFLVFVLLCAAGGVAGWMTLNEISKGLPDLGNVNTVATFQTTRIFDAHRREIASLAGEGNRLVIPDKQIHRLTRQAVVSIEDRRFYSHPAVDVWGIMRALWVNIVRRSVVQGGSTITQQYVKNAYFTQKRTLSRKVREALLAYRLEKKYSKDEILDKYLNTIYFGQGAYGIEAAAQTYFGKHARQLTLPQAAMLAGLIRSPARYNPFKHPETARQRRAVVLSHMVQEGYVTQEQADKANLMSLPTTKTAIVRGGISQYFIDHVTQRLVELVGERAAFSGGLKVFTTLDLDLQKAAQSAIDAELDRPKDPSASLVAVDPRTGAVRVMVGGRDYRSQQYNMATQGRRQPGSSFKPFVLAAGISRGVSPDQYFDSDSPVTFEVTGAPDWKVSNYEGHGSGYIPLTEATWRSVNAAYANLIMQIGPDAVVVTAQRMGIYTPLNRNPAIALGGLRLGVNTLEMASAYGTLGNQGVLAPPYTIERIIDAEGDIVPLKRPSKRKALDPAAAFLVTDTLKGVIQQGTARSADIGRPQAGKTGTTQNYADAWFVGYVPQMSAAVWVGYPKAQVPMRDVHGKRVTGGSFPARIWVRFMEKALAGVKESDFVEPPDGAVVTRDIDPVTGYLATPYCPHTVEARFVKALVPKKECPVHEELLVPKVVGMPLAEAAAKIKDAGLEASATVVGSNSPKGQVVAQDPAGGAGAKRGQVVRLSVSDGKGAPPGEESTQTAVPSVVGMSLDAAESALARVGLAVKVTYAPSDKRRDQVLSQRPGPGQTVKTGSTVFLTVSGGQGVATVPVVVGLSQEAATARLQASGFVAVMEAASAEESKGKRAGTVVRQSPGGGAQAPQRSTVVIYVAVSG